MITLREFFSEEVISDEHTVLIVSFETTCSTVMLSWPLYLSRHKEPALNSTAICFPSSRYLLAFYFRYPLARRRSILNLLPGASSAAWPRTTCLDFAKLAATSFRCGAPITTRRRSQNRRLSRGSHLLPMPVVVLQPRANLKAHRVALPR